MNGIIWSKAMLVLIIGSGIYFSVRLGMFQFSHHKTMWKSILNRGNSIEGISTFESFCTTMAARIGTGNIAGVALAIYSGGPGALFWMWIVGCTNSALAFVECTLGQLFKTRIDNEYRGSGAYCAERGLGWKKYGMVISAVLMVGAGAFMPAAATYTICDSFKNSWSIPMWCSSLLIAGLFAVIIIGGIKRIGKFASYVVPFMTIAYLLVALAIVIMHIGDIPSVLRLIFQSDFNKGAVMGGVEGGLLAALLQGVKRGTFSSAAGMGESTPGASAAETSHPVKQGFSNAAGVFLDTLIVCSATGFMILMTGCYNTADAIGGYTSSVGGLAGAEGGIIYVQEACKEVLGNFSPSFISIILFMFSFTCIISYYYESETAAMYFFTDSKPTVRKTVTWIIRILMPVLVFIWGISDSALAWSIADFALGACTWLNVVMLWFLFPRVVALYKDFIGQLTSGRDPVFDPEQVKMNLKGVDVDLWKDISGRDK